MSEAGPHPAPGRQAPADPEQRRELLERWAIEEGFDRAGVAELGPSEYGEELRRWLERGDQAGMEWIARRRQDRLDPRRLLPGSVSVLCVALQYWPLEGQGAPAGDLWPRVARYARGEDYHRVMERRLRRLGERIEGAFPGTRTRAYVDTGPLLERELAQRAGLGRIGKNTNLLHRRGGSWFLLGELLMTLPTAPSAPPPSDLCGRCTRCLDACPTGALPEPFRLDARRCISYWTIEHRGALPVEAREMLGDWVFGCDVCQEVCPWNARAEAGDHEELRLPEERRGLDLVALARLGREEYVERFRHSPMKRAKLEGLQRNAVVAMGNRGDLAYLEPLAGMLGDRQSAAPEVRGHAAWAIGRIGRRAAARGDLDTVAAADSRLRQALAEEAEEVVAAEIGKALTDLDAAAAREGAPEGCRDPSSG